MIRNLQGKKTIKLPAEEWSADERNVQSQEILSSLDRFQRERENAELYVLIRSPSQDPGALPGAVAIVQRGYVSCSCRQGHRELNSVDPYRQFKMAMAMSFPMVSFHVVTSTPTIRLIWIDPCILFARFELNPANQYRLHRNFSTIHSHT
jgi:hypothetical protein